jgi:hypothetical protein
MKGEHTGSPLRNYINDARRDRPVCLSYFLKPVNSTMTGHYFDYYEKNLNFYLNVLCREIYRYE